MVERWESVVCMLTCFQCILSDVHSTTATRNSLTALRRLSSPVSYMRPAAHFVRRVHAAAPTRTRCATRQAGTRRREEHSQRRASHNLCSILHRTRCRAGDGCAQNMGKSKGVSLLTATPEAKQTPELVITAPSAVAETAVATSHRCPGRGPHPSSCCANGHDESSTLTALTAAFVV